MSTTRVILLVLVAAVVSSACVDHKCPKGYREEGDTCYRIKDAGLAEGGTDELDAEVSPVVVDADSAASPSKADSSPTEDADDPGEPDASTEDDSSTPNGPAGPCQGSSGAPVCVGSVMHHCSANGESERTEECASAQQCQTGTPFQTCAPCLKGKFQCKETRLERCSEDGQRWELAATCDSAALCNETAGACTDKACTAATRVCDEDVLTGCNATFTALASIKKCQPGLCDQAQGECDICVASAKRCDQDVVVSCDADGRKETRIPCSEGAPRCTGSGNCVECVRNTDCTGEHELCTGNRCVVQPYCGDGQVTAEEECDPRAATESIWTCSTQCKKTTTYTWCPGNVADAQGSNQGIGCGTGEVCSGGACIRLCNVPGDCPAAPAGTSLAPTCTDYGTRKICLPRGCKASSDCAPGLVCVASTAAIGTLCTQCSETASCPSGRCQKTSPSDMFSHCE